MGSSHTKETIRIENVIITIKGKKYKINLNLPLHKIIKALEEKNYLVFKAYKVKDSNTEVLKRITTSG